MRIYVCVDDTDDLTKATSTGKIADLVAKAVEEMGGVLEHGVTRHQLLLHKDIAYTSHNSSMCFVVDIEGVSVAQIQSAAEEILLVNMAQESDPGLCICRLDRLQYPERLIAYGLRAQQEVIQKQEAYDLAAALGGTVLTEYGGTGIGVIGALAGVGLRLYGNDGSFRGRSGERYAHELHTAGEWKALLDCEQVLDLSGEVVADSLPVRMNETAKLMYVNHQVTLIVKPQDGEAVICHKKELYDGDQRMFDLPTVCDGFALDNDIEECREGTDPACYNCLYRRWTPDGFVCVK